MPTDTETKDQADATSANDQTDDQQDDAPAGLNDAGKLALKKERDARREAQRQAKQHADELAALKAEKAQLEAERQQAAEADAARKGEFEKLATDRKAALDAATADKQALSERLAKFEERDRQRIEAGLKAIKESNPDVLEDFAPLDPGPDADVDKRLAWFEVVEAKARKAAPTNAPLFQRTPNTPRPVERSRDQVLEDEKMRERARHGLRPRPRASS